MDAINNFGTFLLSCLLLNITPGSDTILTLTKSIAQGKNAGMVTALGIGAGTVVHTMFAAFGLSIIIAQSIMLFNLVKYAGAVYLVYLGIKMLLSNSSLRVDGEREKSRESWTLLLRDGFLSNVLNPKVALFFIAFLPQFVDPSFKAGSIPFLFLGLTFTTTGTLYLITLAIFAARIFDRLRENQTFSTWLSKGCGGVLVGLGAYVAFLKK